MPLIDLKHQERWLNTDTVNAIEVIFEDDQHTNCLRLYLFSTKPATLIVPNTSAAEFMKHFDSSDQFVMIEGKGGPDFNGPRLVWYQRVNCIVMISPFEDPGHPNKIVTRIQTIGPTPPHNECSCYMDIPYELLLTQVKIKMT